MVNGTVKYSKMPDQIEKKLPKDLFGFNQPHYSLSFFCYLIISKAGVIQN